MGVSPVNVLHQYDGHVNYYTSIKTYATFVKVILFWNIKNH
jgi:hypothetical protein